MHIESERLLATDFKEISSVVVVMKERRRRLTGFLIIIRSDIGK